jgi:hypothetical protein
MSTVQEIAAAIQKLSPEELKKVQAWLEDFMEDQLELTDDFKAEIERAEAEVKQGIYSRRVTPE